jgi:hypothetical protein
MKDTNQPESARASWRVDQCNTDQWNGPALHRCVFPFKERGASSLPLLLIKLPSYLTNHPNDLDLCFAKKREQRIFFRNSVSGAGFKSHPPHHLRDDYFAQISLILSVDWQKTNFKFWVVFDFT